MTERDGQSDGQTMGTPVPQRMHGGVGTIFRSGFSLPTTGSLDQM